MHRRHVWGAFAVAAAISAGCGGSQATATGSGPGAAADGSIVINRQTILDHIEVTTPALEATGSLGRVIGSQPAMQSTCGGKVTDAPIAVLDIQEPVPGLQLVMANFSHTFVVKGASQYWEACERGHLDVPDGEWAPGRYEIYPATNNPLPISYMLRVTTTNPELLAAAEAKRATEFQKGGTEGAVTINAAAVARVIVGPTAKGKLTRRLYDLMKDRSHESDGACLYQYVTPTPIATFQIEEALPHLQIGVYGTPDFLLVGGRTALAHCNESRGGGGTLSPREPLEPGRYELYGFGAKDTDVDTRVYVTSTDRELAAPKAVHEPIVIDATIGTPKLVTVPLQTERRRLPRGLDGNNCDAFLPGGPDLTIKVLSAPKRQRVIVLPSVEPIVVATGRAGQRVCGGSSFDLFRDNDYTLAFGSADTKPASVTLMFVDETTKLDPLAVHAFGDASLPLARRELASFFPQADLAKVGDLHDSRWENYDLAAEIFLAAPAHARIYAAADLEHEPGGGGNGHERPQPGTPYIQKGEPLLLVSGDEHSKIVTVLTADGLVVPLHVGGLTTTRPATVTTPSAPRPLSLPTVDAVFAQLPPQATDLRDAYRAKIDARGVCRDKAMAPYRARLPKVMPGFVIASKSPEYVRIENAGYAAADKKCGTQEAFEAKTLAPLAAKARAAVDKDRAARLARVAAAFRG